MLPPLSSAPQQYASLLKPEPEVEPDSVGQPLLLQSAYQLSHPALTSTIPTISPEALIPYAMAFCTFVEIVEGNVMSA